MGGNGQGKNKKDRKENSVFIFDTECNKVEKIVKEDESFSFYQKGN